jgi:hypothetical protein
MAEAMCALPPSYLWLECSLHVKPREIDRKREKMDLGRLLRVGEKVKGQNPSRKKPFLALGRD